MSLNWINFILFKIKQDGLCSTTAQVIFNLKLPKTYGLIENHTLGFQYLLGLTYIYIMSKSYEGFLQSNLLWSDSQFGLDQFVIEYGKLDFSRLWPVPPKLRLGHQVEHIYLQLLKASNKYKVLAHSLQLVEYKQTLGELDFIIKSLETEEIIHIELAYKFYLLDPNVEGPIEGLVGPNRSDAFTYKIDKTKNKQMPLLYSDAARKLLEVVASKKKLKIDVDNIIQKVAFYAQIYIPYDSKEKDLGVLDSQCVAGSHLPLNRFVSENFESDSFHFPNKSEWIHIPHYDVKWMNYESAITLITKRHDIGRSPMLWVRRKNAELFKLFITHWD